MSQLEARMGQVEIQTGILDGIKSSLECNILQLILAASTTYTHHIIIGA